MPVYVGVTGESLAIPMPEEASIRSPESRVAELFDAHHVRLYRLARRMSRTTDEARDMVQETFLRAARAVAAIPAGESSEAAWLTRVLVNVCRDDWRKRAGRARIDHARHVPPAPGDPEAAFIARTTIWRALQQLPPRRRAAVVMYELEGASIAEIARLLGVSAVTVRWHLSRGRKELASVIQKTDGGYGNGPRGEPR